MHDNGDDTSRTEVRDPDRERVYFEFLADMGFTKHIGGIASTEELIERCHIDGSKYVLDVGCGVGGDALSDPRGVIEYLGYGIYVGRK